MPDDVQTADGRRIIGLYIPFETAGVQVREIQFEPCTFGHLLRWQEGKIEGTMALMCELSGRRPHEIEGLRRPDDQRVMAVFLEHVHPEIAADINQGVRPLPTSYGAGDGLMPATPHAEAPQAMAEFDDGSPSSASDPLGGYDGFEAESTERPIDWIPGLDPP